MNTIKTQVESKQKWGDSDKCFITSSEQCTRWYELFQNIEWVNSVILPEPPTAISLQGKVTGERSRGTFKCVASSVWLALTFVVCPRRSPVCREAACPPLGFWSPALYGQGPRILPSAQRLECLFFYYILRPFVALRIQMWRDIL